MKQFRLKPSQIKPIATGRGGCFATDRITVDGMKIGFMYRDTHTDNGLSGWVFMSGTENQGYMDDPGNIAIYDVNTIANYDPDIIPFLDSPAGSAFGRNRKTGNFEPERFRAPD